MASSPHSFGISNKYLKSLDSSSIILDYGSGHGAISLYLIRHGYRVVAADIDWTCEQKLRRELSAEENGRLQFFLIKKDMPFPEDFVPFGCIICREVLEHVDDPSEVLNLFGGLLAENGILILSVPTYWSEHFFSFCDPNWLRKSEHLHVFKRQDIFHLLSKHQLLTCNEEGQSFRWTVFWFILAPFRVKHKMGNPESHVQLVKIALIISRIICSVPVIEKIGNRLLPKSRFYYAIKRKPRILVVYDFRDWILGKWAANIHRIYNNDFDIVTISMFHAYSDKTFVSNLINKVDIIHLLLPHPFLFFKKLAHKRAIITTVHHWIDGYEDYSSAVFGSDHLVTGAKQWKDRLIDRGVPNEKITVVHSGVEDRFFFEQPRLLPKSSKYTCGFCAKWSSNEFDRKGTRHLIQLIESMRKRGVDNYFRLIISGPGWEKIVTALKNTGLETIYLPYVEIKDMPSFFQSLDVYLMLSDVEGGPVTIAEAMASGCLVFSTNIGIAGEIINNMRNGLLIDTSAPEDIVDKLLYYRAHPDQKHVMCAYARKFADEHMRYDHTMVALGEMYREVFNTCKGYGEGLLDTESENTTAYSHSTSVKQ